MVENAAKSALAVAIDHYERSINNHREHIERNKTEIAHEESSIRILETEVCEMKADLKKLDLEDTKCSDNQQS